MIAFTNCQARQFLLLKQGLIDAYRFNGKQGAMDYITQAGCIQFDPIDVCGKNPELVLQSRVKDFSKGHLDELLYKDRRLVDYTDKNLSIFPTEDWPYFERYRQAARLNSNDYPEMQDLEEQVRSYIQDNGEICSSDMKLEGDLYWRSAIHWSGGKNLSRSILEQMYSTGDLVIHHKKGARKYYDLSENHISPNLLNSPEPLEEELEHQKWRVLRRIGAVGFLWNRPSDAWLNIWGLKADKRNEVFRQLLETQSITEISVDGLKSMLYCCSKDMPLVDIVLQNPDLKPRCELIAPLDNFMWDRKLIKALFDFDYTWEIYTPEIKRKYGFYVLPVLYGENFIGRVEAVVDRKSSTLVVKNIWYEDGVKQTRKFQSALNTCLKKFAQFNKCDTIFIHNQTSSCMKCTERN